MQEGGKPRNLIFVYSEPRIDCERDYTDFLARFPFVDHVFSVYTRKYIIENRVDINCGGRKCMECIRNGKGCYFKAGKNNPVMIKEEKK